MGGGLLQLVAYGAQDAYLSGNPQITFWKGLFKRHTNFAMEPFRINFTGQPAWGTKQTAIVGRHADLLFSTYIEVVLPTFIADGTTPSLWNNSQGALGFNLIKYVELDIGGQIIDRIYGEFMYLWATLTSEPNSLMKLGSMIGGNQFSTGFSPQGMIDGYGPCSTYNSTDLITNPDRCNAGATNGGTPLPNVLYIPLPFFYAKNPGAALPLISLQYHEVKINVLWNDPQLISGNFTNVDQTGLTALSTAKLSDLPQPTQAAIYIDYIYLDTEERRRMAQASHEYLIEQTQFNEDKSIIGVNNRIDLTFNHPVKELIWVVQPSEYTDCRLASATAPLYQPFCLQPFVYDQPAVYEQWLQINGQDRLDRRYGDYYNKVQPYQHHTGVAPGVGVYAYSFALKPEEHQPSGTCNFSRIDTATIVMTMAGGQYSSNAYPHTPVPGPGGPNPPLGTKSLSNQYDVRVYATNYNILRIMSGMGGLAFSN